MNGIGEAMAEDWAADEARWRREREDDREIARQSEQIRYEAEVRARRAGLPHLLPLPSDKPEESKP